MKIRVFTTGGTIDGLDYASKKDAPKSRKSFIRSLMESEGIMDGCKTERLMAKDSRFLTEKDRQKILEKCKGAAEDRIIITHGTITMAETAKFLGSAGLQKTIVLTGALIPADRENSDAPMNMKNAISAAIALPHGVYVAMNGIVLDWKNVRKNLKTGMFEPEKE